MRAPRRRGARVEPHELVDLHALAIKLAPLVALQLAKMLAGASESTSYSSRRGCGPAGVSDERWKEIAAQIGQRPPRARWYVVPRATYEQWLARQHDATSAPPMAKAANDSPSPSAKWHPAESLQQMGRRLIGGDR